MRRCVGVCVPLLFHAVTTALSRFPGPTPTASPTAAEHAPPHFRKHRARRAPSKARRGAGLGGYGQGWTGVEAEEQRAAGSRVEPAVTGHPIPKAPPKAGGTWGA